MAPRTLRLPFCSLLASLAFLALASSSHANPVYKSAIITDAATGAVLFEDHADLVGPTASMTKLMTFLIVNDQINKGRFTLQTPVPVTAASSRIGGTQVWLKEGETFPLEDMLYALLIQSANDCAYALAIQTAGSKGAFVAMMNDRARGLGMTHTTFTSPHGLPPANRKLADTDRSTPRDLALLCRYLLRHTNILRYTSVQTRAFRTNKAIGDGQIIMRNHNHLLGKVLGVDGFKTGYTRAAGFCLAATARRNGRRIIAITMGSRAAKERDIKMAELIEHGFSLLPPADSPLKMAPVPTPKRDAKPSLIQLAPVAKPAPAQPSTAESVKPRKEDAFRIIFSIPDD